MSVLIFLEQFCKSVMDRAGMQGWGECEVPSCLKLHFFNKYFVIPWLLATPETSHVLPLLQRDSVSVGRDLLQSKLFQSGQTDFLPSKPIQSGKK
jgi:hypothetical protein